MMIPTTIIAFILLLKLPFFPTFSLNPIFNTLIGNLNPTDEYKGESPMLFSSIAGTFFPRNFYCDGKPLFLLD